MRKKTRVAADAAAPAHGTTTPIDILSRPENYISGMNALKSTYVNQKRIKSLNSYSHSINEII